MYAAQYHQYDFITTQETDKKDNKQSSFLSELTKVAATLNCELEVVDHVSNLKFQLHGGTSNDVLDRELGKSNCAS